MVDVILAGSALFFGGPTAWSRALLLAGLVLALVNCFRFLVGQPGAVMAADGAPPPIRPRRRTWFPRGPEAALYLPLALVLLGSGIGAFRLSPWFLCGAGLLGAVVFLAVERLRAEHGRRGEDVVAGPVLAVVLATATLILVGTVMAVRLAVAPDPAVGFASSLSSVSAERLALSTGLPLLVLLGLLLAERVVLLGLLFAEQLPVRWLARFCAKWLPRLRGRGPTARYLLGVGAVAALFALPLVWDEGTEDADLEFLYIATPEYGKVLYVWVLAVVLARYAIGFRARPGRLFAGPPSWQRTGRSLSRSRHVGYTFLLFGVVGVLGLVRGDLGPTIPLFVATLAVVVFLLRLQVRGGARLGDALSSTRSLWFALVLVVLIAVPVFRLDHVRTRQEAWHHTWTFTWSTGCVPPPSGVAPPDDVPDGLVPCLESLDAVSAGKRSQVAQSLAAVADGGLWGRGLGDTLLGRFPAGDTDFVLAVTWNKLGGVAVLLLGLLLAVLAAALARVRVHLTRFTAPDDPVAQRRARAARLFAVGVAGVLVGQFAFVFACTLNLLPHSGITAPFLSRGGHSTLALMSAVLVAVWLLYRADRPPAPVPASAARTAVDPRPALTGVHLARVRRVVPLAFAVALFAAAGATARVTVDPYDGYAEDRPFCRSREARVDPGECSTDRVANRRTTTELRVGGEVQYVRDRAEQVWRPAVASPALTLADLAGLLRLDGHGGALNPALDRVVEGGSGTSLRERVLPSPGGPEPGYVDLTLDSELQRAVTTALRSDAGGEGPLAGGVVVLDARSGHVLTASSAPSALEWPKAERAVGTDQDRLADYRDNHRNYGPVVGGEVDESGLDCRTTDWDNRCWRWSADVVPDRSNPGALAERRRYAPGTPDELLPSLEVNRALGHQYGLGSTFKVVVAAAYLTLPGTSARSRIPSPPTYQPRFGKPVENHVTGACRGTDRNGTITLEQALAVSCNTAFVALAEQLGWAKIRDTALRLGFTEAVGDPPDPGSAWLSGPAAGVASRVPGDVEAEGMGGIGNNVLGGGRVVGTPLQLATVMTVVANDGEVVQPTIVAATADPFGRAEVHHRGEVREVLTADQARELRLALEGVTGDEGTARRLRTGLDRELRVKTGTHELYAEDEAPPGGAFAKQVAWVVGAFDTAAGPVSFAVAVETKDEGAGSRRAQWLAQQVIDHVVEVRG